MSTDHIANLCRITQGLLSSGSYTDVQFVPQTSGKELAQPQFDVELVPDALSVYSDIREAWAKQEREEINAAA